MKKLLLILFGFALGMGTPALAALTSGAMPYGTGGSDWALLASSAGSLLMSDAATGYPAWSSSAFLTSAGNLGIGTSTSVAKVSVVNQPLGNGSIATTTVQIGNAATTTSRSSIQLNNTVGAAQCLFIVGSVVTVSAGTCK